jgi:hypothetical protein
VTDSGSPVMSDAETITLTVLEVNRAPELAPIGNKVVNEGTIVTFNASATDPDVPAQTLTFSLDAGAPSGASIHPATGAFTWSTDETNGPGVYTVTVRVRDSGSPNLEDSETLTITVGEVNQPPVLNPIGPRTVSVGQLLSFTATATDADRPLQNLIFTLDPGAPSGAMITAAGLFSWTPGTGQGSVTNQITIRVTDDGIPSWSDAETFNVVVLEGPRMLSVAPQGGNGMRVTWTSVVGKRYQLLSTTTLGSPNWSQVGNPVTATQSTTSAVDPTALNGQRFYRVQQLD